jgi:regulator of sirC expression with transglutaminase-like and TPR domain
MQLSVPRQRFIQAVRVEDGAIDLEMAALYIAQEVYPEIDPLVYVGKLDRMAEEIRPRLPESMYPLRVLKVINEFLYQELGFRGNREQYYDPRNSFLNQVLDRRVGIPITLSLVYLGLARRVGFLMEGVSFPGHFLIRPVYGEMTVFVDAFDGGEILFEQDCQRKLREMFDDQLPMREEFFETASNRHFLARMLTNLKANYIQIEDFERAYGVIERILILFPDAPLELRDRGLLNYRLNRWIEARQDLGRYLEVKPLAGDRRAIEAILSRMVM